MLFLLITSLIFYSGTFCKCGEKYSVKKEFKTSGLVFRGTPVAKTDSNEHYSLQFKFSTSHTFKGIIRDTVLVYTGYEDENCGVDFQLNREYLVYCRKADGVWYASSCSRTAIIDSSLKNELYNLKLIQKSLN